MGLITLPGTSIQYFSFSEEVFAIATKFLNFVFSISTVWIIMILAFSLAFLIAGIFYRIANEVDEVVL